jgi:cephalosporin-C deacetylase
MENNMAFFDLSLNELRPTAPTATNRRILTRSGIPPWRKHGHFRSMRPSKKWTTALVAQETFDVTFNGFGGQPVKGWLILPSQRTGKLPCVVEYIGYGGGRNFAIDWLLWASAGYAHFVMDTRGQGSTWSAGDTPDLYADGGNAHFPAA